MVRNSTNKVAGWVSCPKVSVKQLSLEGLWKADVVKF